MRFLPVVILTTFLLANSVHYSLYKQFKHENSFFTQLLYLPHAKYLKPASFGYQSVLADFVYLWSIQYYGDPQFNPQTKYLRHTYEIITDLDPHFLDAYQTGALFMFYEGRNPSAGLALLKKGMRQNPQAWILPADAGFYCILNLRDTRQAAAFFQEAAQIHGSPTLVKRMSAGTQFRLGDKRHAYLLWREVYEQAENSSIKQTAFQHMHDLKAMIDVQDLNKAIDIYSTRFQKPPINIAQVLRSGIISQIPTDPEGNPYEYDPRLGKVRYIRQYDIYKRYQ